MLIIYFPYCLLQTLCLETKWLVIPCKSILHWTDPWGVPHPDYGDRSLWDNYLRSALVGVPVHHSSIFWSTSLAMWDAATICFSATPDPFSPNTLTPLFAGFSHPVWCCVTSGIKIVLLNEHASSWQSLVGVVCKLVHYAMVTQVSEIVSPVRTFY